MTARNSEVADLRRRLEEAEATLAAIREGHVDALVVAGPGGDHVFTLRTADHPYRILVETMNEGAATVLSDGTVLYSNRRFCEMLDCAPEDVIGASILDFVAPEHQPMLRDLLEVGLTARGSRELALRGRRGRQLPVLISVNRVEIDDTTAICIIATDLTPQKRNEEIVRSERLARLILDQAGEAIVVCDAEGSIVRANLAARSLRRENLIGARFETAFPLRLADGDGAFTLAPVLAGQRLQGVQLHLDSTASYLLLSAGPLKNDDGAVVGCVVTLTNFTEMQNVTAALRRTNAELEQFAFAAAHDLQEPLRMVNMYSQLLLRVYEGKVDKQGREFASYIEAGLKRMQALLLDLLSYSKLSQNGGPEKQVVDADEVVRIVLKNCEATIGEKAAVVTVDPLPPVYGVSADLLEVFQNLLSNALKYSDAQPRIRVFATRGPQEHTFAVQDNGIGIEPQYHEQIFGLFRRLHGQDYPGTGIGLAICKRVVEKLGGRIWVESQKGQGATFYFTVPAAPDDSQ